MLLTPERSEEIKTRIQAAVEDALLDRDVSARRVSLDVVGNDGLIRDIRAGRLPGVDRLEALFEYLGLEFYLGPRRKPSGTGGFGEPGPRMSELENREALRAGYLPIPWHPQSPRPAGQPASPVAFAKAWLDAAGLDPERLAAVCPDGSDKGETVALVETAAARKGAALWAYRDGGRTVLGRLQFEPNVTVILPTAPEGSARVLQGEERGRIALIGRVAWTGRLEGGAGPA